jgi:lysophospholipase L1-like esterase
MTICIFGDSITWGAWDCENGGWADLLKKYLLSESVITYNLGISDDTTEQLLKRFDTEVEARNPDIIIFAIGINDSMDIFGKKPISLVKFADNLAALTDKALQITNKIVFIGLTSVDETKTIPYADTDASFDNQSIGEYDEAIRSFCEENDLIFIDALGLLINDDDLCDGLHPSSTGHQKMFETIKDAIEPLWKE